MKQKRKRATNSLVDLPPIIPEWRIQLDNSTPELERLCNIVGLGYSVALKAQKDQVPREDRCDLFSEFQSECEFVLGVAGNLSKFLDSIDSQHRSRLFNEYALICDELEILVKKCLLGNLLIPSGKVPLKFSVLLSALSKWLVKAGVMSSLHAQELKKESPRILAKLKQGQQEPVESGGNDKSSLPKAERLAYESYRHAVSKNPNLADATDDDAYDWIKENGPDDYELPSRQTWKRQVRFGRNYHGTQKNAPRVGRTGRSIVNVGQIQYQSSQKAD